jgi:hypothetical protein
VTTMAPRSTSARKWRAQIIARCETQRAGEGGVATADTTTTATHNDARPPPNAPRQRRATHTYVLHFVKDLVNDLVIRRQRPARHTTPRRQTSRACFPQTATPRFDASTGDARTEKDSTPQHATQQHHRNARRKSGSSAVADVHTHTPWRRRTTRIHVTNTAYVRSRK